MSGFLNDLRFGLRQLIKKPGFAAAAILTLALGIGANTAVFSFLSGYLLKPLPYPHGAQLAQVDERLTKLTTEPVSRMSLTLYKVIQQHTDAFAATAFYDNDTFNLNVGGRAKHVFGVSDSASLFHVLDVQPLLGRTFTATNMHAGSNHVAVISYELWRDSFGADPDIIGKTVQLDDGVHRIIGVMPQGFAFPDRTSALWVPYPTTLKEFSSKAAFDTDVHFIGRLKPGVSLEAAKVQVQHAVSTYIHDNTPAKYQKMARGAGFAMGIRSYRQVLLGNRPATLWLLQGAVLLILLMTCVNVANCCSLVFSAAAARSQSVVRWAPPTRCWRCIL